MKELVDAVTTIGLDDTTITTFGMLLNHIPRVSEEHARFDNLDRLLETFSSCFNYADRICVRLRSLTHVVRLIQITVETFVVECDVEVKDVAIKKNSLIGYTMADHFIG